MEKNKENYKYLLRLYSQVDDYLAEIPNKQENLPEIIVAFCITTEKLLKIKLHGENPILVYGNSKIKENETLISIVKEKELSIETIKIREAIERYKLMFENELSDDEMQALIDIYTIRNHFVHGFKSDDNILLDKENIVKKMGTVWEKISTQAVSIFGRDLIKANKPKKKYSEEQLEKVLIEEVRKKIQPVGGVNDMFGFRNDVYPTRAYGSVLGLNGEKCPRCGSYDFSLDDSDSPIFSMTSVAMYNPNKIFSYLYKCKKCNLELTKKEFEITKKINDG